VRHALHYFLTCSSRTASADLTVGSLTSSYRCCRCHADTNDSIATVESDMPLPFRLANPTYWLVRQQGSVIVEPSDRIIMLRRDFVAAFVSVLREPLRPVPSLSPGVSPRGLPFRGCSGRPHRATEKYDGESAIAS